MTPAPSRLHVPVLHRVWAERLVSDVLRPDAGALAVDLPCGDGALSVALARTIARVAALDTHPDAVAACGEATASLGLANVEALPLDLGAPTPRLGAAVAGSVLTLAHRADPAGLLTAVAATLRPGARLAAMVWAAPDAVPPVDALLAAFGAVAGFRPPELEAAISLGRPGALESLASEAGLSGARVDRLRDVARFDGVEHLVAVMSSAYGLEPHLDALGERQLGALLESLAQRLLPWTAWDGTLVVPVEGAVLYAVTGVE